MVYIRVWKIAASEGKFPGRKNGVRWSQKLEKNVKKKKTVDTALISIFNEPIESQMKWNEYRLYLWK